MRNISTVCEYKAEHYIYTSIYIYMSYLYRKHCFVKEETDKPVIELQVLYTGKLKML